jgi:hypothetical protein
MKIKKIVLIKFNQISKKFHSIVEAAPEQMIVKQASAL